jgi:hypothetical protein
VSEAPDAPVARSADQADETARIAGGVPLDVPNWQVFADRAAALRIAPL